MRRTTMERDTSTDSITHEAIGVEEVPARPEIPAMPPAAGGPPKRRLLITIMAIVAATLVGVLVLGIVVAPRTRVRSDVILDEHFEPGDTPEFTLDSDPLVDQRLVGGAYQVTIKDADVPQIVRHIFLHTRDGISFEATIATRTQGEALASVGCWTGESAYLFALESGGEAYVVETIRESTAERRVVAGPLDVDAAHPGDEPNQLRIDCVGGGTGPTVISGYVNDVPVVSVSFASGYDSFQAVGFFVGTDTGGTTFTIDDVIAREARPAPGMSPVTPTVEAAPEVDASGEPAPAGDA